MGSNQRLKRPGSAVTKRTKSEMQKNGEDGIVRLYDCLSEGTIENGANEQDDLQSDIVTTAALASSEHDQNVVLNPMAGADPQHVRKYRSQTGYGRLFFASNCASRGPGQLSVPQRQLPPSLVHCMPCTGQLVLYLMSESWPLLLHPSLSTPPLPRPPSRSLIHL